MVFDFDFEAYSDLTSCSHSELKYQFHAGDFASMAGYPPSDVLSVTLSFHLHCHPRLHHHPNFDYLHSFFFLVLTIELLQQHCLEQQHTSY